jgi:predicted 3-demethylubiquinone-9 3-methyltransferase (glyoxalase superfamily)
MQKIQTFLWFNDNAEDAAKFYTSAIKNSKSINTWLDQKPEQVAMPGPQGKPMAVSVELDGREFILFNGGPHYHPNSSISFTIHCKDEAEIDATWKKLADGGKPRMELAKYPWSEKYGWIEDKFGVNWQLTIAKEWAPVTPSFLFCGAQQGRAEEAINFWTSQFPNSNIDFVARYEAEEPGPTGQIKYSHFTLDGLPFIATDSGHPMDAPFTLGISMFVNCHTQDQVDNYWERLGEGGHHDRCGWLQDKFGVSWQIVPTELGKLMSDKTKTKVGNVMQAMLGMSKLIIADLEAAANNVSANASVPA